MTDAITVHSLIPLPQLLQRRAYLGGRWIDHEQRDTVRNPANESGLWQVVRLSRSRMQSLAAGLPVNGQRDDEPARRARLERWIHTIRGCQNALALIHASESGTSWQRARDEIRNAVAQAEAQLQQPAPSSSATRAPLEIHGCPQAPLSSALNQALPALLSGRPVLLYPPRQAPLGSLALAVIAARTGLPAGSFNVVP